MINESGDDAPEPSLLRSVVTRLGIDAPRTDFAFFEVSVNAAIERYAGAFAGLESSSDGKARQDHIDGLCDLWSAAAQLEYAARNMRSLVADAHKRCVAADVQQTDVSGEELILLLAATFALRYWDHERAEAQVLARQRTKVEADRIHHRVSEQFLACSAPSAPENASLVDPGWLTERIPLLLTPDEFVVAALACRVAALEFASSMSEFVVISPAYRLGRTPFPRELEGLALRLEHRPHAAS